MYQVPKEQIYLSPVMSGLKHTEVGGRSKREERKTLRQIGMRSRAMNLAKESFVNVQRA